MCDPHRFSEDGVEFLNRQVIRRALALFPGCIASGLHTANRTFGAQLAQRARDARSADCRQGAPKIRIPESCRQARDCIADHVALRAAPRGRDADTLLELTVRLDQHHADEVLPTTARASAARHASPVTTRRGNRSTPPLSLRSRF